jgi:Xaa-Pro dipeptidase
LARFRCLSVDVVGEVGISAPQVLSGGLALWRRVPFVGASMQYGHKMSAHHTNGREARAHRYAAVLDGAAADAFVLTSEPALQHALGVRLYSQRLIPQRPVACVVAPPAPPVCVCVEYEVEQLALEAPGLELRTFGEVDGDPWQLVADALDERGARRVIVEDTMLATWLFALRDRFTGRVDVSYDATVAPRTIKDDDEIALVQEASRGAEVALAQGAALLEPGRTEADVARAIVLDFLGRFGDRAGELTGICTAPQNNRAMHHRAGPTAIPAGGGPVRVGIVARVDGYWVLLTRMLLVGSDDRFARAYEDYAEGYEVNLATLRAGGRCSELYAAAAQRLSDRGQQLTSQKIGHGTGIEFRELPWVSAYSDTRLEAGTVLAYDYGADADAYMLHVEDRVLVAEDGPRRLSDGWDLRDVREGFRSLL